ncbi:class IV adenylate cyclase [Planctomyces sp. SH-PL62]|uniref:class IV adenylate cyclase n=1 Tax=Planctomyces sp. SH-PL62 TaxID=1636152 RepID=UPI00078BE357|nr:class IV adenylate cyclase [Planctomyces sp. SH-PL62]AMV37504.1 CYTH domain protein [Planctomyces sp. SH-PL62]
MSFEVELKYRDVDHDRLTRALKSLGAEEIGSVDQEDSYLNHPSRDFAETREAFRIRRVGDDNRVTFKGPREAGPTKTREEIEIPFASGPERYEELSRLYDRLGFRRVAVVRKRRTTFRLRFEDHDLEIALDRAEGLGDFAEVEAVAQGREDLPRAQQAVLDLAAKLDLLAVEPRSYLRMYLEERSRESS